MDLEHREDSTYSGFSLPKDLSLEHSHSLLLHAVNFPGIALHHEEASLYFWTGK